MKPIFNSLGSNYSNAFVLKAKQLLFSRTSKSVTIKELTKKLSHYFPRGKCMYFYKGRDAITEALNLLPQKNNKYVFIQAFACYAIEEAVVRAGFIPYYIDIDTAHLNMSYEALERARLSNSAPAAILIQHTLGYAADIEKIRTWCDKYNVFLIEDVAQAFGAKTTKGENVGSTADLIIGSFGRDKILDAVSGGFLWIPHTFKNQIEDSSKKYNSISFLEKKKDMLYPVLMNVIRNTYPSLFSKCLMKIAKVFKLISTPLAAPKVITSLPAEHTELALMQLKNVQSNLENRREKSNKYFTLLQHVNTVQLLTSQADISNGSNLRFPVFVKNPQKIIKECELKSIYISDRWYREAVDCSTLKCSTIYQHGTCINAEYAANHIINLPTHQFVTDEHIQQIINILKKVD